MDDADNVGPAKPTVVRKIDPRIARKDARYLQAASELWEFFVQLGSLSVVWAASTTLGWYLETDQTIFLPMLDLLLQRCLIVSSSVAPCPPTFALAHSRARSVARRLARTAAESFSSATKSENF